MARTLPLITSSVMRALLFPEKDKGKQKCCPWDAGAGSLSSDLKLLPGQCQHTGVLLPYAATTKFLLLIPGLSADTQPSVSTGWGSQAATDAKMSIRKPEASGLGWAAWEQGGKGCVVGDSCLLEYF